MQLDKIKKATLDDLPAIINFYQEICAHQVDDQFSARWTWGQYPTADDLHKFITENTLMMGYKNNRLAAAGVLSTGEDYPTVKWPHEYPTSKVGTLHLYALHPDFRGHGLSSALLQAIINVARKEGKKVIHLDVLSANLPAAHLYAKNGFAVVSKQVYHYDDIGDNPATFMEYQL